MNKDSKISELVDRVEKGERLTVTQMAKKLHCGKTSVSSMLTSLTRRHGIVIRPVGTVKNPYTGVFKEGILTMAMDDEDAYKEVKDRHVQITRSSLTGTFRYLEIALQRQPEALADIEHFSEELQLLIIDQKKALRKNKLLLTEGKK